MMTDYAHLVNLLYEHHKTWRKVSWACGYEFSGAYFWGVAKGEIHKPGIVGRRCILTACNQLPKSMLPSVTELVIDRTVRGLTVNRKIWDRVKTWKDEHFMTWNQWMKKAQDLMEGS